MSDDRQPESAGSAPADDAGQGTDAGEHFGPAPDAGRARQDDETATVAAAPSLAATAPNPPGGEIGALPVGGTGSNGGDPDPIESSSGDAQGAGSARRAADGAGSGEDAPIQRIGRVLAGVLAAAVILSLAGLLWWRLVPDAPPAPPLPTPGPTGASATTFEEAVVIAQAQAEAWLPGARLLNATMQVDWPWRVPGGRTTDLPATGWVTTVFLAPWDAPPGRNETAASLSVVLERLSRQVVLQESLGWETAELPAATPTPGIDSTVASLLAERAGGAAFRRACPELRHLSRIGLVSNAPGFPQHWLVTYEDSRRPELHGLLLRIDAATGEVVDRAQDAPPCPGSEPGE